MQRSTHRLRLSEIGPHVKCVLCLGYLIDATTIVECLHSFCRSCLLNYLNNNNIFCPICDVQIHKTNPLLSIKPDKTLQDIVYKLVPGLFRAEMRRRRLFYAKHPQKSRLASPEERGVGVERVIYSPDDSFSLSLEYYDAEREREERESSSSHSSESGTQDSVSMVEQPPSPLKRYLQCPALVTIAILKKFIRMKYDLTPAHRVEVFHRRVSLANEYTLMDVAYIYTWKGSGPMRFFYRITEIPLEQSMVSLPCTAAVLEHQLCGEDVAAPDKLTPPKTETEDNLPLEEPAVAVKSRPKQEAAASSVLASLDQPQHTYSASPGNSLQEQICQAVGLKSKFPQTCKPSTSRVQQDANKGPGIKSQPVQTCKPLSVKAQHQQPVSKSVAQKQNAASKPATGQQQPPTPKLTTPQPHTSTGKQQQLPAAKPTTPQLHTSTAKQQQPPAIKQTSQQKLSVAKLATSLQNTAANKTPTLHQQMSVNKLPTLQQQTSGSKISALQQTQLGKPSTSQQPAVLSKPVTLQQAPGGKQSTSQKQQPAPINKLPSSQQQMSVGNHSALQSTSVNKVPTSQQQISVNKTPALQQQIPVSAGKPLRSQQTPANKLSAMQPQASSFAPPKPQQPSNALKASAVKAKEEVVKQWTSQCQQSVPTAIPSPQQQSNSSKVSATKTSQQNVSQPLLIQSQEQLSTVRNPLEIADNCSSVHVNNNASGAKGNSGIESKVSNTNVKTPKDTKCSNSSSPQIVSGVAENKSVTANHDTIASQSCVKLPGSVHQQASELVSNRPSTSGLTSQSGTSNTVLLKTIQKSEELLLKARVPVGNNSVIDSDKGASLSHNVLCATSEPGVEKKPTAVSSDVAPDVRSGVAVKNNDKLLDTQNAAEETNRCAKQVKVAVGNSETGVNRVLHTAKKNPNQQILTKNEEIIKTSIPVKRQAFVSEAIKRKFQSSNSANDSGSLNKNKPLAAKKPRLAVKQSSTPPIVKQSHQESKAEPDTDLLAKKVDSREPGTSRDRPTSGAGSDPISSNSAAQDRVSSEEKVASSASPILNKTSENIVTESKTKLSINKTELTIPVPKTLYNKQTSVDKVVRSLPSTDTKLKSSTEIGNNKIASSNHKHSYSPCLTNNQQVAGASSSAVSPLLYSQQLQQPLQVKKTENDKVTSSLPQLIEIPKSAGKKLDPTSKQDSKTAAGQDPKQDGIGALDLTSRPQQKPNLSLYPPQSPKSSHSFTPSSSPLSPVGLQPPFPTSPHTLRSLAPPPHQLRIPNLSRIPSSPSPHRAGPGSPPAAKQRRTSTPTAADQGKRPKLPPAERSPDKSRHEATTSRMPSGLSIEPCRDFRMVSPTSRRGPPPGSDTSPSKTTAATEENCPGSSRLSTTVDLADSAALRQHLEMQAQQLEMQASLWGRAQQPHPEWAQNAAHLKQWESIMKSIGMGQMPQMPVFPTNNNTNKKSSR